MAGTGGILVDVRIVEPKFYEPIETDGFIFASERTKINTADQSLFNENEASRKSFATDQLAKLITHQQHAGIRFLYQYLAVIAFDPIAERNKEFRTLLENISQTPFGQPDGDLWKLLSLILESNAAKQKTDCNAMFSGSKGIISLSGDVAQPAIKKLYEQILKPEVLLNTLKACPCFLAQCPADLLFTMAKDNVEVAAYILKNQFQIDKMLNANKQKLLKLIAVVAESAWSNEASSEDCKTAIYYLLEHNLAMFLDSENDIRLLDYMLNFHLSPDPAKRARTPKDISTILDIENKNVITQLSRFFSSGRASQTLSQCPRFRNALDAKDLFDLAMIDYDMARFIFTDAVYRKRIETLPPVVGHGNALSRIEKYGYPGSLFFTHLVISSPPDSSNTSLTEVNTHYRWLTAALVVFEGDKNGHIKAYTDSVIQSDSRLELMLTTYRDINFIDTLNHFKNALEQLSKLSKEDVTRAQVELEIKAAQANLKALQKALDDLNAKLASKTLTEIEQEKLQWLHIVNRIFPFNQLQAICQETLPLSSEVEILLTSAKHAVGQLYKHRDDLMPQYKLWQLSGGRRAISKPVSKSERSSALNQYLLPGRGMGQFSPDATWQNVEDLIQLRGHYRTLVEMSHLTAMFAGADDGERLGKLLRFIAVEPQLKNKLVNSKLFETASGNSVDKRETTEKQAIGNLQDLCYGEQSYFRENPDFAWVLFSDFPELCEQLFKNKPDEFIELLRAMQNKNMSKKAFLTAQASWLDGNMLLRIAPALNDILTKKDFDSYFGWGFGKTPRRLLQQEANTIADNFSTSETQERKESLINAVGNSAVFDVIDFSMLRAVNLAINAKNPVVYSAISKRDDYVGFIADKNAGDASEYHNKGGEQTAIHIAVSVKRKIKKYGGLFNRAKLVAEKFRREQVQFSQAEWQYIVNSHSRLWAALTEKPGYFSDERYESRTEKLKSKSPFCRAKLENKSLVDLIREDGIGKASVGAYITDDASVDAKDKAIVQNALLDEAKDLVSLEVLYRAFNNVSFKDTVMVRACELAKENPHLLFCMDATYGDLFTAIFTSEAFFSTLQLEQLIYLFNGEGVFSLTGANAATLKTKVLSAINKKLVDGLIQDKNKFDSYITAALKIKDATLSRRILNFWEQEANFNQLNREQRVAIFVSPHATLEFRARVLREFAPYLAEDTNLGTLIRQTLTASIFYSVLIQNLLGDKLDSAMALINRDRPELLAELLDLKEVDYAFIQNNSNLFNANFIAKLEPRKLVKFFNPENGQMIIEHHDLPKTVIEVLITFPSAYRFLLTEDKTLGKHVRQKLERKELLDILVNGNFAVEEFLTVIHFYQAVCPLLIKELLDQPKVDYAFITKYEKAFVPDGEQSDYVKTLESTRLIKFFNPADGQLLASVAARIPDFPKTIAALVNSDYLKNYLFLLSDTSTLGTCARTVITPEKLKSFFDPNTWQILPAYETALTGYPALIEKLLLSPVAKVEKKLEEPKAEVTSATAAAAAVDPTLKTSKLDDAGLVTAIRAIRLSIINKTLADFSTQYPNPTKEDYRRGIKNANEQFTKEIESWWNAQQKDTVLQATYEKEKGILPFTTIRRFQLNLMMVQDVSKKHTGPMRNMKTGRQVEMQNFVLLNAGLVDALVAHEALSAEALLILLIELPENNINKAKLSAKLNDSHIGKLIARAAELEDQIIQNVVGAYNKIVEVNKILGPMTSRIFALSAEVLLGQSEDMQRLFLTYFASFVRASNSPLKSGAEKYFQKLLNEKPLLFMRLLDNNGNLLKKVFASNKQFFFGMEGSPGFLTLNLELIINNISVQQLVKLLLLDENELKDFIFSDDRFVLQLISAINSESHEASISVRDLSRSSQYFGGWLARTEAVLDKKQIACLIKVDQILRIEDQHITSFIFSSLKYIDLIFDNEHITRYPDRFAACLSETDLGNAKKVAAGSVASLASSDGKSTAELAMEQRNKLNSTSSSASARSSVTIKTTSARLATLSDEQLLCLFRNGNADIRRRILTNSVFAAQLLNTGNETLLPILQRCAEDLAKLMGHKLTNDETAAKAYGQQFRKALKIEGLRLIVKINQPSTNQFFALIATDNQEVCQQYQARGEVKAQAIYDENGYVFLEDVVLSGKLLALAFADADKIKAKTFIEKSWQKLEPVLNTQLKTLTDVHLLFLMGCQNAAIVKWFDEQVATVKPDFVVSQLRAIPVGTSIQSRWAFYLPCLERLRDKGELTTEDIKKCFGVNQAKVHVFLSSVYSKQKVLVLQIFITADSQTVAANLALFSPMLNAEDLWILNQASFNNTQFMKCFAADGAVPKEFVDGMMRMAKTQITGSNPFESLNPFKCLITLGVAEKANKSYAVHQIFQQNQALVTETLQAIDSASWSAEELTYLLRYADIAVAIFKNEALCQKFLTSDETKKALSVIVMDWINNSPPELAAQREQFLIGCFGSILCGHLQKEMIKAGLERFTEKGDKATLSQFNKYFLLTYLSEGKQHLVFENNIQMRKSAENNPLFATMLLQMPQDNDRAKTLFKYVFIDGVPSLLSQKLQEWLSSSDAALVKSIFAWGLHEGSVYQKEFQAAFDSINNSFALLQNPHFVHEAFQEGSLVKSYYEDCRELTLQQLLEHTSDDYWEIAKRDNLNLANLVNEHFAAQINNKAINGLLPFINNVAASQLISHENQQKFKALFATPEMKIEVTGVLKDFLARDAAVTAHSATIFSAASASSVKSPDDVRKYRVFGAKS